jgi:predicted negative regulator of RcsB-dependent stress response
MKDHEHTPQHGNLQKKQELEEHEVKEVLGFLKRYGKLIGAGILAAALTVVGSRVYANHKASRMAKAEKALMAAQTPQELENLVNEYSSTPTAPVALLDLAKTYFNDGDTAKARAQYERFLKKYKKHEMEPIAELGLAYCTEADGDFDGAATQFADFAKKYSTSYLHPQAILSVARCMQQANRADEARIVLEDFLAENGGSAWAGTAQNELQSINETTQQN